MGSTFVPSFHDVQVLETHLQAKLQSARPMRVERVQERCPRDAICASLGLKPSGIHRTRIAADDVVPTAARVIGIVDPELGVIKNVKSLGTELNVAGLGEFEMFQHCHVEVQAVRIIEEVPAGVAEG